MLRRALSTITLAALAFGVTACERDGDASDEVVIVTPSEAPPLADEGPLISLPAITPGPAGGELPGGDDPFCAAVVSAVTDYNNAISTYTGEILNASAAAGLNNDMSGINALGVTVNDLTIDARTRMDEALALTDNKPAKDGITGMIGYIDAYLSPVALIMVAATDFDEFNTDIVTLTQSQLDRINRQTGHADAVKRHTEERCGVKLDVLTAG
jgi:hypothetical protein